MMNSMMLNGSGLPDPTAYKAMTEGEKKIFRAMFEIVTERAVYAAGTNEIIKADEIPAEIEKPVKSAQDASEVEALKIEVARWKERAEIFEMLWREVRG